MDDAPRTVLDGFLRTVGRQADDPALRELEGRSWTWGEYAERVARLAGGLSSLGVDRGDRVVMLLSNRLEFHVADLAILALGATPISIYNSSSPEQIAYLATHCKAVVAITQDGDYADRLLAAVGDIPTLRRVVVVGDAPDGTVAWDEVQAGEPIDLAAAEQALDPGDLVTVIYTSGTTGPPKGVMLTHRNVIAQRDGMSQFLGRAFDPGGRLVSYLPMAHIAERMVSHYGHVLRGAEVVPCADIAALSAYLTAVHPTLLFGPPRVWEKLVAGIQAQVASRGEEAARSFAEALQVGRQVQQLRARGEEPTGELAEAWAFVDEVAFRPVRAAVGLDECEVAFSGAAPVPPEVIDFLRDIGLPMSEVYGMSENCGGMTWEPFQVKSGRVGRAFPGVEVTTAADGEVLCRGPIVFAGYLDDPDRTAEALDADGWLHTGDIGEFDDDGYLKIVDRKKELIITAGGKNVSPANVEAILKTVPLVGQAMAVGDDRPYLVALLTLDPDAVAARYPGRSLTEVAADPDVLAEVADDVAQVNQRMSQVERPRRFVLLGEEWLPDSDVLTPTMKLKRRGVLGRYAAQIEEMYAGGGVEVAAVPAPEAASA
ncbi:MAG TPA: long-chain fatty acid--CoA ligase [Mycobacteriales bacterium]|nr:long-chain fatty acid--CoA ligase [Mycobacteriales bacterium]